MDIIYRKGDLLTCPETFILHGCNAQGKMGSGVAKAIRAKYPTAYAVYMVAHNQGHLKVGNVTYAQQDDGKTVINGVTQEFYGHQPSWGKTVYVDYAAVKEVLQGVNWLCERDGVTAVAMSKIGAGLGGGDWDVISKIIEAESISFQPIVYEL